MSGANGTKGVAGYSYGTRGAAKHTRTLLIGQGIRSYEQRGNGIVVSVPYRTHP